jgi:hypothetical protein
MSPCRPLLAIGRFTTTAGNNPDPILQKQAVGRRRLNAKLYCICAGQGVRKSGPDLTPGSSTARAAREERLAKALRENLRRRKEQRRAQQPQEAAQPKASDREREPPA